MKHRSRSFNADGIVLKRNKVGETDRVISLLTQEYGKLVAVAKGVRKLSSSKRAFLEPGNLVKAYFIKTKSFNATMTETDQGYIISKGSEAKKSLSNSCTETYRNMRRKLLETKIIIDNGDKLIFAEDAILVALVPLQI